MSTALPPLLNLWRTLPEELKLEVVRYIVPSENIITEDGLDWMCSKKGQYNHVDLYTYLSIPEIKPLVLEALYKQNIVRIECPQFSPLGLYSPSSPRPDDRTRGLLSPRYGQVDIRSPILFPPRSARTHIRRISIDIPRLDTYVLRVLADLANGSSGFSNFHLVCLHIGAVDDQARFDDLKSYVSRMEQLAFPTRRLEIKYYQAKFFHFVEGFGYGWPHDALEVPLLEKLTVQVGKSSPKETFERWFERTPRYKELEKAEWAAVTKDPRQRYTVKTMSI